MNLAMHPGPFIIVGVVAFIALLIFLTYLGNKKRMEATKAKLATLGLAMHVKPTIDEKQRVWSLVSTPTGKHMWRDGAKGINWFAEGTLASLPIILFEHRYSTGAGKSRQIHIHTVAAAVGVRGLPRLFVREKHLGDKLAKLFGVESISIGKQDFEKHFRIFTDDTNAIPGAFLTPGLREWLLNQPKHNCSLVTGPESLSIVLPKLISNPDEIVRFAHKPAGALAALAEQPTCM